MAGSAAAGAAACTQKTCGGKLYACGDCLDNDGDGAIDELDGECLGPCDDAEDAYYAGLHGQNSAACHQDCYFDNDAGPGNDRCDWTSTCDPLSVAPNFPPSGDAKCAYDSATLSQGSSCQDLLTVQPQVCEDVCLPLTPNGCDCFGCCELPARSGRFVWIGSDVTPRCDAAHLGDALSCPPCTPVPSCFNRCDPCERCVGGGGVASSCQSGSMPACPAGVTACDSSNGCGTSGYCLTGCCVDVPR